MDQDSGIYPVTIIIFIRGDAAANMFPSEVKITGIPNPFLRKSCYLITLICIAKHTSTPVFFEIAVFSIEYNKMSVKRLTISLYGYLFD